MVLSLSVKSTPKLKGGCVYIYIRKYIHVNVDIIDVYCLQTY